MKITEWAAYIEDYQYGSIKREDEFLAFKDEDGLTVFISPDVVRELAAVVDLYQWEET